MPRPYLKIWEWEWIFGRAVKAISSLGVRSPWIWPHIYPPTLLTFLFRRPCSFWYPGHWLNRRNLHSSIVVTTITLRDYIFPKKSLLHEEMYQRNTTISHYISVRATYQQTGKFFTYVTKPRPNLSTQSRKPGDYYGTTIFVISFVKTSLQSIKIFVKLEFFTNILIVSFDFFVHFEFC